MDDIEKFEEKLTHYEILLDEMSEEVSNIQLDMDNTRKKMNEMQARLKAGAIKISAHGIHLDKVIARVSKTIDELDKITSNGVDDPMGDTTSP